MKQIVITLMLGVTVSIAGVHAKASSLREAFGNKAVDVCLVPYVTDDSSSLSEIIMIGYHNKDEDCKWV